MVRIVNGTKSPDTAEYSTVYFPSSSNLFLVTAFIRRLSLFATKVVNIFDRRCMRLGGETFWTSGMYSTVTGQWMWYRQDWTPRSPIASNTFRGWRNNAEPRPTSDLEACLVVDINTDSGDTYWRNDICIFQNYYICEIPKICY